MFKLYKKIINFISNIGKTKTAYGIDVGDLVKASSYYRHPLLVDHIAKGSMKEDTIYKCKSLSDPTAIFYIPRDRLRKVYTNINFKNPKNILNLSKKIHSRLIANGFSNYEVSVCSNKEVNGFLKSRNLHITDVLDAKDIEVFNQSTEDTFEDFQYYIIVYSYSRIIALINVGQYVHGIDNPFIELVNELDTSYDNVVTLNMFTVSKAYRKKGLGRVLLNTILSYYSEYDYMFASVRLDHDIYFLPKKELFHRAYYTKLPSCVFYTPLG